MQNEMFAKLLEFKYQKTSTVVYLHSKAKQEIKGRCRYLIFLNVLKFWELLFDLIFVSLTDGYFSKTAFEAFFTEDNITSYMANVAKSEHDFDIDKDFVFFYSEYKKEFAKSAYDRIKKIYYDTKKDVVTKIDELTTIILEHINIRLLELSNMDISCKLLKENCNIDCPYNVATVPRLVDNTIRIMLVPEYFEDARILPTMFKAICKHIKHPQYLKIILDFRVVVSRSKEIDVQKIVDTTKRETFEKVISRFGEIIFYKPFFGIKKKYEDIEGIRIINDCEELKKILDEHRQSIRNLKCSECLSI